MRFAQVLTLLDFLAGKYVSAIMGAKFEKRRSAILKASTDTLFGPAFEWQA